MPSPHDSPIPGATILLVIFKVPSGTWAENDETANVSNNPFIISNLRNVPTIFSPSSNAQPGYITLIVSLTHGAGHLFIKFLARPHFDLVKYAVEIVPKVERQGGAAVCLCRRRHASSRPCGRLYPEATSPRPPSSRKEFL